MAIAAGGVAVDPHPEAVVQPIIFVPAGLTTDAAYAPAVDRAMLGIAAWDARELSGRTIHPLPVKTVPGRHPLAYYCPPTIDAHQCISVRGLASVDQIQPTYGNIINELAADGYAKAGVILVVFWVGGYDFSAGGGGSAIVGDTALSGISGARIAENSCADFANRDDFAHRNICTPRIAMGVIVHEMGHALGLPHPTDDGRPASDPNWYLHSVMLAWWDFPNVTYIDSPANPERTTLAGNPQLHPSAIPSCPSDTGGVLVPRSLAVGALCAAEADFTIAATAGRELTVTAGAIPPAIMLLALSETCDAGVGPVTMAKGEGRLTAIPPCSGTVTLGVSSEATESVPFALRVDSPEPTPTPSGVRQVATLSPHHVGTKTIARGTSITFSSTVRPLRLDLAPSRITFRFYQNVGGSWILRYERHLAANESGVARTTFRFGVRGTWYVNAFAERTPYNQVSRLTQRETFFVR